MSAAAVVAASSGRGAPDDSSTPDPARVLGEAALLCRVSGRLLAEDPALAQLEGLGAAQARLGEVLTRALDPRAATEAVVADPRALRHVVAPFVLLGDLDAGHRAVALALFDLAGEHDLGDEPGAAQRLGLAWLRGLADGCASPDVPPGSVLERGADLLAGALTDASGLADAVLHATDCGLLPARFCRPATSVADDAEALLGAALATGRLDLVARLLCAFPVLGLPLGAGARHALAELDRAEAALGFLPGPGHGTEVANRLAPADRSAYVVRTSGSTAAAGAVLAALLLRDGTGARPDAGHPASARRPASARCPAPATDADPLVALDLADGPWADPLREGAIEDRVGCTELVLGAELHAAARHRDTERVRHVVDWATAHGWAHLPAVHQGLALASRAEQYEGSDARHAPLAS